MARSGVTGGASATSWREASRRTAACSSCWPRSASETSASSRRWRGQRRSSCYCSPTSSPARRNACRGGWSWARCSSCWESSCCRAEARPPHQPVRPEPSSITSQNVPTFPGDDDEYLFAPRNGPYRDPHFGGCRPGTPRFSRHCLELAREYGQEAALEVATNAPGEAFACRGQSSGRAGVRTMLSGSGVEARTRDGVECRVAREHRFGLGTPFGVHAIEQGDGRCVHVDRHESPCEHLGSVETWLAYRAGGGDGTNADMGELAVEDRGAMSRAGHELLVGLICRRREGVVLTQGGHVDTSGVRARREAASPR